MTLIATLTPRGVPVIFGDLLISGVSDSIPDVAIPSLAEGVGDFFGGSGIVIHGMRQKVCVISERLVVAWSGNFLSASVAIAKMREMESQGKFTLEDFHLFFVEDEDIKARPIDLVGWFKATPGFIPFSFGDGVSASHTGTRLGYVQCGGSGFSALQELVDFFIKNEQEIDGDNGPAGYALCMTLTIATLLIRAEHDGRDAAATLRNFFGGGYELAMFFEGKFKKIGDFTIILWEAVVKSASEIELSMPKFLLRQAYKQDTLLMKSAFIGSDAEALKITNEQGHVIFPMGMPPAKVDISDFENLKFGTNLLCHCISAKRTFDGKPFIITLIDKNVGDPLVQVVDGNGEIRLSLNSKIVNKIATSLLQFVNPGTEFEPENLG
ncbi:MAG: hypothetical protein ACRYGA_13395 [Janthinobacterium lividum]